MKFHKRHRPAGFSLVEIVVGVALLIFVLTSFTAVIRSISKSTVTATNSSKLAMAMQAVGEQLRAKSIDQFDTMGTSVAVQGFPPLPQTFNDNGVYVSYTVGDVTTARSRIAALNGEEWQNGVRITTRSQTIELIQVRGSAKDTSIQVYVKDIFRNVASGGIGVGGINVSVRGQYQQVVTVPTDANGLATLPRVYLSVVPLPITIEPLSAPASNGGPCFGVNPTSATITINAPPTQGANHFIDLSGTPVEVGCSGGVGGVVLTPSNVPVPGIVMQLNAKPGSVLFGLDQGQKKTTSLNDGSYAFNGLLPGLYSVTMLGNSQSTFVSNSLTMVRSSYPASAAAPGDYYSSNTGVFLQISTSSLTTKNFQTMLNGSINGYVYYVDTWNGAVFTQTHGPPVSDARVYVYINQSLDNYHAVGGLAPDKAFNFANTTAWNSWVSSETAYGITTSQQTGPWNYPLSDASGQYALNYLTPRIVDSDTTTYPLAGQYNYAYMGMWYQQYSPGPTSILVINPFTAPEFAVSIGGSIYYYPVNAGGSSPKAKQSDFTPKIFLGAVTSTSCYVLKDTLLAEVSGNISGMPGGGGAYTTHLLIRPIGNGDVNNSGVDSTTNPDGTLRSFNGHTPARVLSGGWDCTNLNPNCITLVGGGGAASFDTGRIIVPNLGADQTMIRISVDPAPQTVIASLTDDLYIFTKTKDPTSGAITRPRIYPSLDPSQLNYFALAQIEQYDVNTSVDAYPANQIQLTSNNGTSISQFTIPQFRAKSTASYTGSKNFNLYPGDTVASPQGDIPVQIGPAVYKQYYLKPDVDPASPYISAWSRTDYIGPRYIYSNGAYIRDTSFDPADPNNAGQKLLQVMIFNQVLSGTIFGNAYYPGTGVPIPNIKVTLSPSGFANIGTTTQGSSGYNYSFNNFHFTAAQGQNFTVTFHDPASIYQDLVITGIPDPALNPGEIPNQAGGYDGCNFRVDGPMLTISSSSGGQIGP